MKTPTQLTSAKTWDRAIGFRRHARTDLQTSLHAGGPPTVEQAIAAWLTAGGFAPSTAARAHEHLESTRARGWRSERNIVTITDLTAGEAASYVMYLRDRGAAPATVRKVRNLFRSLQAFCAEATGYRGLEGDELERLKMPPLVERIPPALTDEECLRLIAACGDSLRDRLIVETLLLAGLRVSELCALTVDLLHLDSRPAFVHICGSVHNPRRPKTPQERRVIIDYDASGFGRGYVGRLRHYIEFVRPKTYHRELFLSRRQEPGGDRRPLTYIGVQRLMTRLETVCGIHCNPHKLRHTFATRCVDKGVPMFHLQDALGHRSLDMVRRYYSQNRHAQAEGFYRAFGARYST